MMIHRHQEGYAPVDMTKLDDVTPKAVSAEEATPPAPAEVVVDEPKRVGRPKKTV